MGTASSTHGKIINANKRSDLKHEGNRQLGRPEGRWGNAITFCGLITLLVPET
jgi:hypothetical protein